LTESEPCGAGKGRDSLSHGETAQEDEFRSKRHNLKSNPNRSCPQVDTEDNNAAAAALGRRGAGPAPTPDSATPEVQELEP
jgi:hypothetical protein